jgi:hypothetical protein
LGAARHEDVEARADRCLEERGRRRRHAAELHQAFQPCGPKHELADVDGAEAPADAFQYDVQPMPLGQHGVDERATDVDSTTAGLEHPLDQLLHLGRGEHQVRELVTTVAGDEDPARVVDPNFFDGGIVQERLQRTEPGDPGDQLADDGLGIRDRGDGTGEAALVVVADHALRDPAHHRGVPLWVHPFAAHQLTNMLVELVDQLGVGVGQRHGSLSRVGSSRESTTTCALPTGAGSGPVDSGVREATPEPIVLLGRPFLVKRSWILLVATLLGLSVAPIPQTPASASCAAPYIKAGQRLVLERGATTTLEGRAFVDGCRDTMSCSAVPGCSHCEYDEPAPTPLQDVALRLRQGDRAWKLDNADAETAGGRVTWSFVVPAGVRPGPAKLLPEDGDALRVRVR